MQSQTKYKLTDHHFVPNLGVVLAGTVCDLLETKTVAGDPLAVVAAPVYVPNQSTPPKTHRVTIPLNMLTRVQIPAAPAPVATIMPAIAPQVSAPQPAPARRRQPSGAAVDSRNISQKIKTNPVRALEVRAWVALNPTAPDLPAGKHSMFRMLRLITAAAENNNQPLTSLQWGRVLGFTGNDEDVAGAANQFMGRLVANSKNGPLPLIAKTWDPTTGRRRFALSENAWAIVRTVKHTTPPRPSDDDFRQYGLLRATGFNEAGERAMTLQKDLDKVVATFRAMKNEPLTASELVSLTGMPEWKIQHILYIYGKGYVRRLWRPNPDSPEIKPARVYQLTAEALTAPVLKIQPGRKKKDRANVARSAQSVAE